MSERADHLSEHPSGATDGYPGEVTVGVGPQTIEEVVAVARGGAQVRLDPAALAEVRKSRAIIEGLADDVEPHYGVSTGFGA